jgi:tetratricopeptide (TPR) repeat protein
MLVAPGDPRGYYNWGMAFLEKKNPDQTVKDFSYAIKLNPNLKAAYLQRIIVYKLKNNAVKAEADMKKSMGM